MSALYGLDIECIPACSDYGPIHVLHASVLPSRGGSIGGSTAYHSMQWSIRNDLAGYQFDLNYTFKGDGSRLDLGPVSDRHRRVLELDDYDPWDRKSQRAVSDFDMAHQLNGNWFAELPFGRGKRYLRDLNPVAEAVLGGWQVSGLGG